MATKRYQVMQGVIKGINRDGIVLEQGWKVGAEKGHTVNSEALNGVLKGLESYEVVYLHQQLQHAEVYISNPMKIIDGVLYCSIRTRYSEIGSYLNQFLSKGEEKKLKMG